MRVIEQKVVPWMGDDLEDVVERLGPGWVFVGELKSASGVPVEAVWAKLGTDMGLSLAALATRVQAAASASTEPEELEAISSLLMRLASNEDVPLAELAGQKTH